MYEAKNKGRPAASASPAGLIGSEPLITGTLRGLDVAGLGDDGGYPDSLLAKLRGKKTAAATRAAAALRLVRFGYLLHYSANDAGMEQRLIAGDHYYALGLAEIKELGLPSLVAVLARLIDGSASVVGTAEDLFLRSESDDVHGATVRTSMAWQAAVYEMAWILSTGLSSGLEAAQHAGSLAGMLEGARRQGLRALEEYAGRRIEETAEVSPEPVATWLKGEL